MNDVERAELRALADLLSRWPTADATAIGYSATVVAVIDATVKDYTVYVHEPVTL